MNRLKIWIRIICHFLGAFTCSRRAHLMDPKETTEEILKSGKSLIRLGDGELNILRGRGIHYQDADPQLQEEFRQLVSQYLEEGNTCNYLLCMPNPFLRCSGWKLARKRVWVSCWSDFRYVFKKHFDRDISYGDAFSFAEGNLSISEKMWQNKDEIIFVHNNLKCAENFQEKYCKKVHYIQVPGNNCYSEIDHIIDKIKSKISDSQNPGQLAVLLSAGPCAKVIIYRLLDCGVQMIDTGHCWDEPLTKI